MTENPPESTIEKNLLIQQIEALIFVSPEPVSVLQLAEVMELKQSQVAELLEELIKIYQGRGIRLQEFNKRFQFTTAPETSTLVEKMLGIESTAKLSRAALEAMAVVAYKQPVTRPGIDAIRGVNSDGVVKSLLSKGLIEEIGRAETPGRPILYGVTDLFLQHFGLEVLSALPPFELPDQESSIVSSGMLKD